MSISIVICMGSSCFARGNAENLRILEAYIARHKLDARIRLSGCRCHGACFEGPNVTIDGVCHHHVDGGMILDLLESAGVKEGEADG